MKPGRLRPFAISTAARRRWHYYNDVLAPSRDEDVESESPACGQPIEPRTPRVRATDARDFTPPRRRSA